MVQPTPFELTLELWRTWDSSWFPRFTSESFLQWYYYCELLEGVATCKFHFLFTFVPYTSHVAEAIILPYLARIFEEFSTTILSFGIFKSKLS